MRFGLYRLQGAAIRVRKTVPTEPKQPAGAGGNTAAAAADDVLFAGAGHDDDAAFGDPAEGAADVAGGGRHRHRRTSWSMAKEEAVTFILASPAATHGAPVRASVSPSEVVRAARASARPARSVSIRTQSNVKQCFMYLIRLCHAPVSPPDRALHGHQGAGHRPQAPGRGGLQRGCWHGCCRLRLLRCRVAVCEP